MAYTLISCVGTGMFYDKVTNDKGYRETVYQFSDEKTIKTKIFLEALLSCDERCISGNLNKIILVGTTTSNWGALIESYATLSPDIDALYFSLYEDDKNGKGISDSNRKPLEECLSHQLNVPVKLFITEPKIDDSTAFSLFTLLHNISPEIDKDSNVLFDITHGFRSIPLLVYQALQYTLGAADSSNRKVELVYGEYVDENKKSYVRNLSKYWTFSQLSDALNVFNTKLDGFRLAELIEEVWPKGSKAIKKFSEIVQTNFSLQIIEVNNQLKNSLSAFPQPDPDWLSPVKDSIEKIVSLIDEKSVPRTLYNYSKFLYDHHLNVQAVITLQVAVETSIVERYDPQKKYGDYDWWKNSGSEILFRIKGDAWKDMGNPLTNLEFFRNQIAHGGSKNNEGNFPQAANIPNIYKSGRRGVKALFEHLGI